MSEQLLTVLRICLLILMYLVFLRVVRAVWVEIQRPLGAAPPRPAAPAPARAQGGANRSYPAPAPPPAPVSKAKPAPGHGPSFVTLAPPSRAGIRYPLDGEITIGRAAGCRISVPDDGHVSKLHARVFFRDNRWFVEDLGSTNGTRVHGEKIDQPTVIRPGDQVQFGETVLELT